jgi:hypothetical protein
MPLASKTQKRRNSFSGHSRRRRKNTGIVPVLKHSFDVLEHEVAKILATNYNPKQRIRKFQEIWKNIFGHSRPIEASGAEAYLLAKSQKQSSGKSRKAQKGGSAVLSGSPVDFQTRPGVDGTHGSFPQYVSSGLSFYNTINQDQLNKGVKLDAFDPAVPQDMGSNLFGGGILADAAFLATTRPATSVSPPTLINDIQTALQGRPLGASPDASQNQLKYM